MDQNIFHNAMLLNYVAKNGGEMLNDFNAVLKNSNVDKNVKQLQNLTGHEFIKTNANEVMSTGQTGFGKEFVEEVVLVSELIDRLRLDGSILSKATIKQMTARKMDFPVRGAKVRMVSTTEHADLPTGGGVLSQTKKAATAKITLEAKTLVITIYYSDELLEDSVIEIGNYVMSAILDAYEHTMHQLIINGDTATDNTNINIKGGAITGLPDGASTDILKVDGARKIAITKKATVDAQANFDLSVLRSARAKMGLKGVQPADLILVPDQDTYFKLLNLTEVETIDKFGDAATIKNGKITHLDGIEIVSREEMGLADVDGTISATTTKNVKGQMLLIHTPSLYVGIRRGLTTEISRYAEVMQTGITGSARVDVKFLDIQNNARPTSPTALITNI